MPAGALDGFKAGGTDGAIANNPLFSAGLGLILVTGGLSIARKFVSQGLVFVRKRILVSVEIPSRDPSYPWILNWLNRVTPGKKMITTQLAVETSYLKKNDGSVNSSLQLVPGSGTHYLKYNSEWLKVDRVREKNMIDINTGAPWETITLTTLRKNTNLIENIIKDAEKIVKERDEGKIIIYKSYGQEWRPLGMPRKKRNFHSVILARSIAEEMLMDIKSFFENEKWYRDRGIPYRRGYLLHGPPGTGKTSIIQALAGELGYNVCIINMGERGMTDDRLSHLLVNVPPRCFILLEDIDSAFVKRETSTPGLMVTFSGLLNALDGIASADERISFMTTNNKELLDEALLRPGRVDREFLLDRASLDQAKRMFLKFYEGSKDLLDELHEKLAEACNADPNKSDIPLNVSPAQLQGYFILYKNDPKGLIRDIKALV